MNSSYPKVLIFGQPFNNYCGGGITLTNLFKGWPKEKIAVAYMGHGLSNVTTEVCDTYYQLGREEHKWRFPLNLFQKSFPSGLKSFSHKTESLSSRNQTGFRNKFVNHFFYPFLKWMGLFHSVSRISLSQNFQDWLSDFKPEVLYVQVSSRETLLFAEQLIDFLKIPSVNHVMDDWPSTLNEIGLFRNYWLKKIDAELKRFNDKVNLHFSISEAMSDEYLIRYGKKFIPFHNPVESKIWLPYEKKNLDVNKNNITILYSGRIGIGISDSLMDIATAIDSVKNEALNIKLHIQTFTKEPGILNRLQKFNCIVFNPFVAYEQLPKIFSEADILLLANDFSEKGLTYLKFSMPTKASEYMVSGTPILLYAPKETAISKFFLQHDCGCCVTERSSIEIINALNMLFNDEDYRRRISQNAHKLAAEKFDQEKVRGEFQQFLADLSQK
jgi:glycosyltransferase involved in cell wall biosynthesis